MKKNKLFLEYTELDFVPNESVHVNSYTWSILKESLSIEHWDEVVNITSVIIDDCINFPSTLPHSDFEEIIESVVDNPRYRFFNVSVWGCDCILMTYNFGNEQFGSLLYTSLKNIGFCLSNN